MLWRERGSKVQSMQPSAAKQPNMPCHFRCTRALLTLLVWLTRVVKCWLQRMFCHPTVSEWVASQTSYPATSLEEPLGSLGTRIIQFSTVKNCPFRGRIPGHDHRGTPTLQLTPSRHHISTSSMPPSKNYPLSSSTFPATRLDLDSNHGFSQSKPRELPNVNL